MNAWIHIAYAAAMVLLPILGLLMLGGVLVNVFQVGLLWLPDRVAPDFSRVSPLAGLKRIFSLSGTSRLGFGLVKVLIVAARGVRRAVDAMGRSVTRDRARRRAVLASCWSTFR